MSSVIDDIGQTAFFAAHLRAEEAREANPLFVDPFATLFTDEAIKRQVSGFVEIFPLAGTILRLRTRYFDDVLSEKAIAAGIEQIVILGAGFDSRPLRFRAKDVRYFEIDREPVIAHKKTILDKNGCVLNSTMISGDYTEIDLRASLCANGFDSSAPAFVLWEGNTMYLSREKFYDIFRVLGGLSRHIVLSFDYVAEGIIRRTSGNEQWSGVTDRIRQLGAPLLSGFDGIEEVAHRFGYTVREDCQMEALRQRYLAEKVGMDGLTHFSVATTSNSF